jgi:hypothetical protein
MTARERLLLVLAAAVAMAVAVAMQTGGYRYYDLLGDPFTVAAIGAAATVLALAAAAAGTVRWRR